MQDEYLKNLESDLARLKAENLYRELKQPDKGAALFCSNDYLGLSRHPKVIAAAQNALKEFGTGAGASRLVCGNTSIHQKLEDRLAMFKEREAALVFSSGFAANQGIIPELTGEEDTIIVDRLCHASILDGCWASRAKLQVFQHNNVAALEKVLSHSLTHKTRLVIVEAVYSMDGDIAPLPEIVGLAKKYNALLMVDEAHSTGVLGATGRGIEEHFGLKGEVDILMGTLSKALGSMGGFIAGKKPLIDFLVNHARSFIYSTALAPSNAAAALEALEVISRDDSLLKKLRSNLEMVKSNLTEMGYNLGASVGSPTPIIPIILGSPSHAIRAAQFLQEHGIFLSAIRPPTVPRNESRLRLTVNAQHNAKEIEKLVTTFKNLKGYLAAFKEDKPELAMESLK